MNNIVVTLDESDLIDLQIVILDADEAAALEFLKTRIVPKIPTKGSAPCDSTRLNPYLPKSSIPRGGTE